MEERMIELIKDLNYYTKLYDLGVPKITDKEWDTLYFELKKLEEESGVVLENSPTQKIEYSIVSELKKVEHNHPMLSLDKTKDWDDFVRYFSNLNESKDVIGMLKLDGLTCSLKYLDGELISAETRGDGKIGEDILHNALTVKSIPKSIPYKKELIVDGEIICTYQNFEDFKDEYKNPRNFASGSIRLLDANECAKRKLTFVVWNVVTPIENSVLSNFDLVHRMGFTVTPWTSSFDWDAKEFLQNKAKEYGYPIDGLVGRFDDVKYGESLGSTEHHIKAAYAFKFYDEEFETNLLDIEWQPGRFGNLTPVAIFEPVDDGESVVERASLHNVSVLKELLGDCPRKGQVIKIAKMNMIIPQVISSEKVPEGTPEIFIQKPKKCPICGGDTKVVKSDNGILNLVCINSKCDGKLINCLDHFCGKNGLDIKGLSSKTLEKLLEQGWIYTIEDIFNLEQHKEEWIKMSGFGEKSVSNILDSIKNSSNTTLEKFIVSIGISLIGSANAKEICKHVNNWEDFRKLVDEKFDFEKWDTFGPEKKASLLKFDYSIADKIASEYLTFEEAENSQRTTLKGKTIVITGSLKSFSNRNELKEKIESLGGKVASAISKNTTYLVNNDINSTSGKNKRAKELNIPIITEEELIAKF